MMSWGQTSREWLEKDASLPEIDSLHASTFCEQLRVRIEAEIIATIFHLPQCSEAAHLADLSSPSPWIPSVDD
jgi:hypothetical protein